MDEDATIFVRDHEPEPMRKLALLAFRLYTVRAERTLQSVVTPELGTKYYIIDGCTSSSGAQQASRLVIRFRRGASDGGTMGTRENSVKRYVVRLSAGEREQLDPSSTVRFLK
jgi:hypothetical protein